MRILLIKDIKAPDSDKQLKKGTAHHFDNVFSELLIKEEKAIKVREGELSKEWIKKVIGTVKK
jgi:hypothetical protein